MPSELLRRETGFVLPVVLTLTHTHTHFVLGVQKRIVFDASTVTAVILFSCRSYRLPLLHGHLRQQRTSTGDARTC